jgi:hypothetical protein
MSSTLFGRGTTSQVGGAHRAESLTRDIADIRKILEDVKHIPEIVGNLTKIVESMQSRLSLAQVPELNDESENERQSQKEGQGQVTREEFDDLTARIEAVRFLQAPSVTIAMFQAFERRIDAKIAKLTNLSNGIQ